MDHVSNRTTTGARNTMSAVTSRIKARRTAARGRRDFQRALHGAATPALRDELITMAQAQNTRLR